jgi:preprotein translocase subunit SecF
MELNVNKIFVMKLNIVKQRKINYSLSVVLFFVSILSLIVWGLKPGLDFTGGSLLELQFSGERPVAERVHQTLQPLNLGDVKVQLAGDDAVILRLKEINQVTHQEIISVIKKDFERPLNGDQVAVSVREERFESVGPVIGKELAQKSWMALALTIVAIVGYIAYAFRKVAKPIASWKYGVAAIFALVHDIIIVTGLFSILGYFMGVEVDALFITALLTILGFSVHDTIVVFDRIRENLSRHYSNDFEGVINDSVNQTFARSINTSLTTLMVLVTLFLFGGESIRYFVLALIVGITLGTYSSIFVAAPLLIDWLRFDRRRKNA